MGDFFVLHRMLSADAQFDMGVELSQKASPNHNPIYAAVLFKAAAEKGHRASQFNLGCCYQSGIGVQVDEKRAAYWYLQSAKQGFMLAEYNLAQCFDTGQGVPLDSAEANRWYRKSADRGYAPAQFAIAINIEEGRGFSKDVERAVFWYQKALAQSKHDQSLTRAVQSQIQARISLLTRKLKILQDPKPETIKCPRCGREIRYSVMTAHMSEMHGNRPGRTKSRTPRLKPKKIAQPKTVIETRSHSVSTPTPLPASAALRQCLCPRCGGDGGVRGGCTKCDGTGWVAEDDVRGEPYRPDRSVAQDSLITSAHYQGENLGAHQRDLDGRFGSAPLYDDYGDESHS